MGIRKRKSEPYTTNFQAYLVLCPQRVKDTIISFFADTKGYKKKATPIVINGARLFSMVEFSNSGNKMHMMALTRYGSTFLDRNCADLLDNMEIYNYLRRYFNKSLADQPEILSSVQQILPTLSAHYDRTRFMDGSPYAPGELDGRFLCFFYPILEEDVKGLKGMLIQQHADIQKEIRRERLTLY